MKSVMLFIAVVMMVSPHAYALDPGKGWKLAKQGDDILVYTRPVAGSDNNEFLGVTDVDAPIKVILEVFKDKASFPEWYGLCKEISLFRRISELHEMVYFVLATPWPVKDRDMLVEVVTDTREEEGITVISMSAIQDGQVPVQDRYVRMTELKGEVVLTRMDENTTHVTYTVSSDPAGSIPASISNMMSKDQPYMTLKGLRKMVKNGRYYELAGLKRE